MLYLGRVMEIADRDPALCQPAPSLYPGVELGGAATRPDLEAEQDQDRPDRRSALAAQSALGLPIPYALPRATEICAKAMPDLLPAGPSHMVVCHHADLQGDETRTGLSSRTSRLGPTRL